MGLGINAARVVCGNEGDLRFKFRRVNVTGGGGIVASPEINLPLPHFRGWPGDFFWVNMSHTTRSWLNHRPCLVFTRFGARGFVQVRPSVLFRF